MSTNQELIKQLSDQKYALDQAAIVAATDSRGTIVYVNDKFCEISGYSRDELIGKTHRVVNSGFHHPDYFEEMWKTISKGRTWHGEICNRNKSGAIYWVNTTIVPFLDEKGKPHQYVSIRHEITELKEAKQVIEDQQVKLASAARLSAIGELAAAITHEINNPLGVILGRVEMIKMMLAEDEVINKSDLIAKIDSIEITAKRIEKIVKGMKTMAHHQEDEMPQKVYLNSILNDVVDLCQYRMTKNHIKLEVIPYDEKVAIKCRSHQICQVLVNLLNNSVDAISELKEKWIKIEVLNMPNKVQINLMDSGSGIPQEIQEKMFNPFYSTKTVKYGTGLGLSISLSLIEKNGGTLEYNSSVKNTCFVISFPKQ